LDKNSTEARQLAEAKFKKKQEQFIEGQKAMAEYKASGIAVRENTARLRALRLARDAAIVAAGAKKKDAAAEAAAGKRK
jgi:hypothetical protein